ncbi:MAG TPA: glycosyltransferase [Patescibacteria group bacterium]|nr:glycosyltransferase [Patescibacteria group bacterium]
MNILLATGIFPPDVGGPATYTAGLANALRSRGHIVFVIAYGEKNADEQHVFRISRRGGVFLRYLRYAWRVFCLARRMDVVYAQGPVSEGFPTAIGSFFARKPFFMKVVGDYAWEIAKQRNEPALLDEFLQKRHRGLIGQYERIERWTARRAKKIIVPSRYLKTVVISWGVPAQKISVVINAVEALPPVGSREEERARFGVQDHVVVLTAVRCVPWKGIDQLIRSWRALPLSHVLVIAGDGPELAAWKQLALSEGVDGRVEFLGRASRELLSRWYAAADAFVLPSGYEGWPHVIAEAVSAGIPCFVSDRGGNPETRELYGELVTVLPYDDERAWLQALRQIGNREETKRVIPRSFEQMVEETNNCLELVLPKHERTIIMLSYDRDLLDVTSAAFARVSSLADKQIRVHAFILGRTGGSATHGNFFATGFQGNLFLRLWRIFFASFRIARAHPDRCIVTAQDPFFAGWLGFLISRFSNAPLEIQEHGDFFSGFWEKESFSHRCIGGAGRWILRRAERVRAVSLRVKEHLVKAARVKPDRIEVIPVSVDLSSLFGLERRRFPSNPNLVVPCRFVRQKGLDIFLEAIRLLKVRGKNFRATITGGGPQKDKIEHLIDSKQLRDCVSVTGWMPSKRLWDDADVFVLSSRYEGWGRTVVEAMAAGVPIVATEVGCVGSFFRPGEDGISVPAENPSALADAIQKQMEDEANRERMRSAARERAKTFMESEELHRTQREGWARLLSEESGKETSPRFGLWFFLFIVFSIFTRALSVILFHQSLLNRETSFYTLTENFLHGFGYSFAPVLGCASAYRSPAYLFFLTALYSLVSPNNTWAQAIVQNLFVIGVLWLVYAVGKQLVGKRAALVAGFLMACYPYTFYHYTQYYHTFLSSFFLLLVLWFVLRLRQLKTRLSAIGAGLSIAGLAYVQGTILPATPFIAFWLLWMWWPDWKIWIKRTALMAICAALLIAPWSYRNWTVFHTFVPLTTDLGFGLAKANNENIYALTLRGYPQEVVDDVHVSSTNPNVVQYYLRPEIENELKTTDHFAPSFLETGWHPRESTDYTAACRTDGWSEPALNAYWTNLGLSWFFHHWWPEGINLQLLKIKTFWQPSLFPSVKMGAPWPFSGWKATLARWAVTTGAAIVVFGGWIGMLVFLFKKNKNAVLSLSILLVYTIMHSIFAGYTKYRIPLDNLMAMYAGWIILKVADFLFRRGRIDSNHSI